VNRGPLAIEKKRMGDDLLPGQETSAVPSRWRAVESLNEDFHRYRHPFQKDAYLVVKRPKARLILNRGSTINHRFLDLIVLHWLEHIAKKPYLWLTQLVVFHLSLSHGMGGSYSVSSRLDAFKAVIPFRLFGGALQQ